MLSLSHHVLQMHPINLISSSFIVTRKLQQQQQQQHRKHVSKLFPWLHRLPQKQKHDTVHPIIIIRPLSSHSLLPPLNMLPSHFCILAEIMQRKKIAHVTPTGLLVSLSYLYRGRVRQMKVRNCHPTRCSVCIQSSISSFHGIPFPARLWP